MLSAPALAALSCIIMEMCRAKCKSPLKTLSNMKTFVPFATLALEIKKSRHSTELHRITVLVHKISILLMQQGTSYLLNFNNNDSNKALTS